MWAEHSSGGWQSLTAWTSLLMNGGVGCNCWFSACRVFNVMTFLARAWAWNVKCRLFTSALAFVRVSERSETSETRDDPNTLAWPVDVTLKIVQVYPIYARCLLKSVQRTSVWRFQTYFMVHVMSLISASATVERMEAVPWTMYGSMVPLVHTLLLLRVTVAPELIPGTWAGNAGALPFIITINISSSQSLITSISFILS